MSSRRNDPPSAHPLPPPTAAALMVWVAIPCAVLAALAGQWRFSHSWPEQPERWALDTILATQWLLAGLIFPRLLAGLWPTVAAMALAAPPIVAAAALAPQGLPAALAGWIWLCLWLASLSMLRQVSRRRRFGWITTAVALGSAAIPVMLYLRLESTGAGETGWTWLLPSTSPHWWGSAIIPGGLSALAGIILTIFCWRGRSRPERPHPDNKFSTTSRA